jgi:carbonic anhydrase
MAEQIITDLKKAGSDDMGSLIDMLNAYKSREENVKEEIEKLGQLSVIKDDEIQNLEIELKSLNDFL